MGTEGSQLVIDVEKLSTHSVDKKPITTVELQNLSVKISMADELKMIGLSPSAISRLLNITCEENE